jgi:hypothetical protein
VGSGEWGVGSGEWGVMEQCHDIKKERELLSSSLMGIP